MNRSSVPNSFKYSIYNKIKSNIDHANITSHKVVLFKSNINHDSRVEHYQSVAQKTSVNMCIYFCCKYGFMPKHFLNSPEISSSFNHMSCKRVSEGMRTYVFPYSCFSCQILYYCKDHCPCKFGSTTVKEEDILIIYHRKSVPVFFVYINLLQCFTADRYKPLFISFSCH